jgi:hypothetical protein
MYEVQKGMTQNREAKKVSGTFSSLPPRLIVAAPVFCSRWEEKVPDTFLVPLFGPTKETKR